MKSYSAYSAPIFGGIYGGNGGSDSSNQNCWKHLRGENLGDGWVESCVCCVPEKLLSRHSEFFVSSPHSNSLALVVFVDTFIASRHGVVVMIVYVCAAPAVHILTLNHCKSGIRCKRTNGSSLMQGARTAAHSCKARFSIVLLMTRGDDNSSA